MAHRSWQAAQTIQSGSGCFCKDAWLSVGEVVGTTRPDPATSRGSYMDGVGVGAYRAHGGQRLLG